MIQEPPATDLAVDLRPAERAFLAAWRDHPAPDPLRSARRAAIERFIEQGLPVGKAEAWKYLDVRRLVDAFLARADGIPIAPGQTPAAIPGLESHRVAVVDGRLAGSPGLPRGVTVTSLEEAAALFQARFTSAFGSARPEGSDAFVALNTAHAEGGVFLHVARGVVLERPIELDFVAARGPFVHPRALVVIEAGAEARVVETWRSGRLAEVFTNAVVEFLVGPDATVQHLRLVDESSGSVHVHHLHVRQSGPSRFTTGSFVLSGGTVRSDAYFLPDGEGCETHLNGFFVGRGTSHVDNHTLVDHAKPDCRSNELYKGILDDRATGVFNGKVLVRQDAQRTNAYQSNRTVLLSDVSRTYSKPELEIYADDVRCSHGATTGRLDEEALFYLRSRGIAPLPARRLLLHAFAEDVLQTVSLPAFREHVTRRLDEILQS